ncbi:hypothetical protein V1477_015249 [Vespula maculifrons]|uniref:Uncharacterized protein n=1 Tax=Vespula maculifrons TaxID=7453 RepID=A0ABD2BKW7_VESMC
MFTITCSGTTLATFLYSLYNVFGHCIWVQLIGIIATPKTPGITTLSEAHNLCPKTIIIMTTILSEQSKSIILVVPTVTTHSPNSYRDEF